MSSDLINLTRYDNLTNVTDPYQLAVYVSNSGTGGLFMLLFMISLWIILFVALMKRDNPSSAAVGSSVVFGIGGVLLVLAGGISPDYLAWFVLLPSLAIAAAVIASRRDV